jgi:hypothetical protein
VLRRTRGTGDAIWQTPLPHGLITLDVIDQVCDIDLHRWTPVRGRRMGWHQYISSSHATTLASTMSETSCEGLTTAAPEKAVESLLSRRPAGPAAPRAVAHGLDRQRCWGARARAGGQVTTSLAS